MKKNVTIILILFAIVILSLFYAYRTYQSDERKLKDYNNSFEQYANKDISGTEIATILNKAIDNNEKNKIEKDEKQNYIENDENSIKIDIYIKDNDTTYSMETIYNMKVENFINSFSLETFKIDKIEYHEKTNLIKYIMIEQM